MTYNDVKNKTNFTLPRQCPATFQHILWLILANFNEYCNQQLPKIDWEQPGHERMARFSERTRLSGKSVMSEGIPHVNCYSCSGAAVTS